METKHTPGPWVARRVSRQEWHIDAPNGDAIALLPGWEMSQGAQLELHIAHRLGLMIGPLETYIEREQVVQPTMPGAGYQPSGGSTQHGPPPGDP